MSMHRRINNSRHNNNKTKHTATRRRRRREKVVVRRCVSSSSWSWSFDGDCFTVPESSAHKCRMRIHTRSSNGFPAQEPWYFNKLEEMFIIYDFLFFFSPLFSHFIFIQQSVRGSPWHKPNGNSKQHAKAFYSCFCG